MRLRAAAVRALVWRVLLEAKVVGVYGELCDLVHGVLSLHLYFVGNTSTTTRNYNTTRVVLL